MRRIVGVVAAVLVSILQAPPIKAQTYPSRVVTIIVPYPAGGPTDQLARVLAPALSERLGQSFIVENVTGGATTIATGRVARAAGDGYTLLLHNLQISANVSLYHHLPFDTERDLTPIIFINNNPLVLIGRKTLEPNTLKELIAYMKRNVVKMAHPGAGATGHLATSLLAQEAHAAPSLEDIAGSHVDMYFATPQSMVQQVAAGEMKAYGITAKAPSPQFPTAASFVQELWPKLEILYWHALFAPAGTPETIVEKLNTALQEIVADPAILKSWAESGVAPYPKEERSPAAARALLQREIARWGEVVRDNNIQAPMQ